MDAENDPPELVMSLDGVVMALDGVKVAITSSDGTDGAMLVLIETDFEPDASDGGPGLRVALNDGYVYKGVEYTSWKPQPGERVQYKYIEEDFWYPHTPTSCSYVGELDEFVLLLLKGDRDRDPNPISFRTSDIELRPYKVTGKVTGP